MQTRTVFLAGLVMGTLLGMASILAPFTVIPGLVVCAWLIRRQPRYLGAAGALVGFGAMWLLLIGQASLRCADDATCTQPDVTPWLMVGAVILCSGVLVGLASYRRVNPRRPGLSHRAVPPPAR